MPFADSFPNIGKAGKGENSGVKLKSGAFSFQVKLIWDASKGQLVPAKEGARALSFFWRTITVDQT